MLEHFLSVQYALPIWEQKSFSCQKGFSCWTHEICQGKAHIHPGEMNLKALIQSVCEATIINRNDYLISR